MATKQQPLRRKDFATLAEYQKAVRTKRAQQIVASPGVSQARETILQGQYQKDTGTQGLIPRLAQTSETPAPVNLPTTPAGTPPAADMAKGDTSTPQGQQAAKDGIFTNPTTGVKTDKLGNPVTGKNKYGVMQTETAAVINTAGELTNADGSVMTPEEVTAYNEHIQSSQTEFQTADAAVAPAAEQVTPTADAAPATTPEPVATAEQGAATPGAEAPAAGTPAAAADIAGLEQQAKDGGISDQNLASAKEAYQKGYMTEDEYIDYLNRFQKKEVDAALDIQSSAATTAATGTVDYYDSAHMDALNSTTATSLSDSPEFQWINSTAASSVQNLSDSGMDLGKMTSADIARYTLMNALNSELDTDEQHYFDTMAQTALETYVGAVASGANGLSEIDMAISGDEFTANTWDGMQAKIQIEGRDLALEDINAQRDYLDAQYQTTKAEDERKNARLEGYLKAKLYSMGAEDSTAGLMIISENMHMAQIAMDKRDADYNYNRSVMNSSYRKTVLDYTDRIQTIVNNAQSASDTALSDYNTATATIEKDRLASAKEKATRKQDALATYMTYVQTAEKNASDEKWKATEFSYKQGQDLLDNAFKMSGMMGSIYTIDPDTGNLVDTGLATFDAKKYASDYALGVANFNLSGARFGLDQQEFSYNQSKDRADKLTSILLDPQFMLLPEAQKYSVGTMIEQQLGMPMGTVTDGDPAEWGANVSGYQGAMQGAGAYYEAGLSESAGASIQKFLASGAQISSYSEKDINLNPLDVPEVAAFLSQVEATKQGRVTQEFGMTEYAQAGHYSGAPHRGMDVVFNDGQVHSATSGTVVKVQPSDGKNPFGGYVWVQDNNGLVWQYAHMPKEATAYSVKVGQQVSQGAALGMMGAEGAADGVHTHISAIGATQNALVPSYGNSNLEQNLGSFASALGGSNAYGPSALGNFFASFGSGSAQGQGFSGIVSEANNLNLSGLQTTDRTKVFTMLDSIQTAQSAIEFLENGDVGNVGPVSGRFGSFKQGLGFSLGATDDTYRALVQSMASSVMSQLSGATITPTEMARLIGFLPNPNDQKDLALNKLKNLQKEYAAIVNTRTSGSGVGSFSLVENYAPEANAFDSYFQGLNFNSND